MSSVWPCVCVARLVLQEQQDKKGVCGGRKNLINEGCRRMGAVGSMNAGDFRE